MRYHVYSDARYIDGEVAAGQTLTVYTDSGAGTAATLYTTQTGATTADNPYTVPNMGIVDFWLTNPLPYALAEDDTEARPLPVVVAPSGVSNVVDYGATGDGSTDDTAAIQAALDAAAADGGGTVFLPTGLYMVSGLTIGTNVALIGTAEGAVRIRLITGSDANVIESEDYATLAAGSSQSWVDGTPYGIRLEDFRIEGCSSGQSSGHGIALYAFRVRMKNVYVYDVCEDGIHWEGAPGTTTGTYPEGQVESIAENIHVRLCGGKGFYYDGPSDAYCDKLFVTEATGDGIDAKNIDFGYIHVYGCDRGIVLNGNVRADHVQSENNSNEGVVAAVSGSQPNYFGRLTCYSNWADESATATDYQVLLTGRLDIGNAIITAPNGGGGLCLTTGADGSIIKAKVVGAQVAGTTGVFVSAYYASLDLEVTAWPLGVNRDFNHNAGNHIKARIYVCPIGFYEPAGGSGNFYDITYNAASAGHTPWTLTSPARSFYRLVSYGSIESQYIAEPTT